MTVSVVIPVYNSASVIAETITRVAQACEAEGWTYEIIAINDASTDTSADVLRACAASHPHMRLIEFPSNRGQHQALLAGLRESRGSFVVCLDDDLQHPPEAIPSLVRKASDGGHDVVFARFDRPQHAAWRRPGSALVRALDRSVFGAPAGLGVSSFRLLRRDVVERVCAYRGRRPYIRGQMLLACTSPADVAVGHQARPRGQSSYTVPRLAAFVGRVLIEWSFVPALMAIGVGAVVMIGGGLLAGAAIIGLGVLHWRHVSAVRSTLRAQR